LHFSYVSDALKEGWIAELDVVPTADDPNILHILAFSMTHRERMLAQGQRSGGHAVQLFDFTANTCGSSMQLGCVMGHLPEAGGMAFPLSLHLWLDAAHEDGDLTRHATSFISFIRRQGLPPPRVLMLDKAVPMHNAALEVNQAAIRSDAARGAERALHESLAAVSAGCNAIEVSASQKLVQSFPSFVSPLGDVQPAGTMPLNGSELLGLFPGLAESSPLSVQAATEAASLFLPAVVREYGPGVIRGLATVADNSLSTVIPILRTASAIGDWNVAAARLMWLESFAAVGGPLESFLQQFVLTFVLLCIFHVLQVRFLLPSSWILSPLDPHGPYFHR